MKNSNSYKKKSIEQWSKYYIGAGISKYPEGTLGFFDEIKEYRYTKYAPWMLKTFNFEQYKGKKVLEIGVGSGIDHLELAKSEAILTGIDITPKSIELTKKNLELHGYQSNLLVADTENLPFKDETFDIVYSFGVLHHTPDIQKAIDEIFRVLKPRGKVLLSLYNKNSLFFWVSVFLYDYILHGKFLKMSLKDRISAIEYGGEETKPLVILYTKKQARYLFKEFKQVKIYTRHIGLSPAGKYSRLLSLVGLKRFFEFLANRGFGWYLIIEAEK